MGLSLQYTLPNGVVLNYHRIVSLITMVGVQTTIEVAGYTSQEKREEELAMLADPENNPCDVFIDTRFIAIDYDPDMSVNKAYAYIKALPEYSDAEDVIDKWAVGTAYYIGDIVVDGEQEYECVQPHASQEGWEPHATPALWKVHEEDGDGIPVWSQPTGAHDAYKTGDKVHYPTIDDPVYESTMDANVYSPEAYPQGWQLVEGGE